MSEPETWQEHHIRKLLARIDELTEACRKALASNVWQHGAPCTCEACRVLREVVAKAGA